MDSAFIETNLEIDGVRESFDLSSARFSDVVSREWIASIGKSGKIPEGMTVSLGDDTVILLMGPLEIEV